MSGLQCGFNSANNGEPSELFFEPAISNVSAWNFTHSYLNMRDI